MKTILFTCGETSGDQHAARLAQEIRDAEPGCRILAMGGDELAAAGAEILFHIRDYAFMGFSEIVSGLPRIFSLEKRLGSLLDSGGIDLFIPVDYPGMNLRLARRSSGSGVPVLYFISPQVWAWAGWRTSRMKRYVDLMAVILPFETEYYEKAGIPVFFAGHPMSSEIPAPERVKEPPERGDPFEILLFPGSREQEIGRHLVPMIEAASLLGARYPRCEFRLGLAPLISDRSIEIPSEAAERIVVDRNASERLATASLVIAASGTVTLQTALSGTPMVVIYRTSPLTYALARGLVRIPHIAMPNVLAGREVVPELIQGRADAHGIAEKASSLLDDAGRYRETSRGLIALRDSLHREDGLKKLAERALSMAGCTGERGAS